MVLFLLKRSAAVTESHRARSGNGSGNGGGGPLTPFVASPVSWWARLVIKMTFRAKGCVFGLVAGKRSLWPLVRGRDRKRKMNVSPLHVMDINQFNHRCNSDQQTDSGTRTQIGVLSHSMHFQVLHIQEIDPILLWRILQSTSYRRKRSYQSHPPTNSLPRSNSSAALLLTNGFTRNRSPGYSPSYEVRIDCVD